MRAALLLAVCALTGCDLAFGLERGNDAVALYRMDSLAGDTLHDDSGHGHDGTCTHCPAPTAGVRDGALVFDGATTIVRVPSAPALLPLDGLTVATWLRVDAESIDTVCLVGKVFAGNPGANTWQLCLLPDRRPVLYANEIGGGAQIIAQNTVPLAEWHHFAVRWDGEILQLVLDGAIANQEPVALFSDDGDLTIGADDNGGTIENYFPGALDDVEIYDRALTGAELSALATRSARTTEHHIAPSEKPEQTSSVQ